jgi:RimJ/RimL family protein N-acetyltransferase
VYHWDYQLLLRDPVGQSHARNRGPWLCPEYWRTAVNIECKYLLPRQAFETLKAEQIEFMIDARNVRSQRAIERLGACKEGILRAHMLCSGYA